MVDYSEVFIGLDGSKDRHAVAVAEGGRDGEVRYFGEIASDARLRCVVSSASSSGRAYGCTSATRPGRRATG